MQIVWNTVYLIAHRSPHLPPMVPTYDLLFPSTPVEWFGAFGCRVAGASLTGWVGIPHRPE